MNAAEIQSALDDVFDQALVYHGFTDYMRDYEVIVRVVADPRMGIPPAHLRYLFKDCVSATVETTLSGATWQESLDDGLIDHATGVDLDGYVWGVKWQELYPGGKVIEDSEVAKSWSSRLGIGLHEIQILANAQALTLVCGGLEVSEVEAGYSPFIVESAS